MENISKYKNFKPQQKEQKILNDIRHFKGSIQNFNNWLQDKITENDDISKKYLTQLLNNTTEKKSKTIINNWLQRNPKLPHTKLSKKELQILNLIKTGQFYPKSFSTKN